MSGRVAFLRADCPRILDPVDVYIVYGDLKATFSSRHDCDHTSLSLCGRDRRLISARTIGANRRPRNS